MDHDDMFDEEFIKESKRALTEFLRSNQILTIGGCPVSLSSLDATIVKPSWIESLSDAEVSQQLSV